MHSDPQGTFAAPVHPDPRLDANGVLIASVLCNGCGYELQGLSERGVCPECSRPVLASLQGDDLRFASTEYLNTLHRGAQLIQVYLILMLVSIFGGFVFGIYGAAIGGPTPPAWLALGGLFASAIASVIGLIGWWMFSERDPSRRAGDRGESPRRIIRITVIISAVATAASLLASLLQYRGVFFPNAGAGQFSMDLAALVMIVISVGGGLAWVVQYFASMLYVRWLAPRIPNERAARRAKLLLWLGPVLYIVLACVFFIGPLIALVLYYNLFSWIRIDLQRLLRERTDGLTPG